VTPSRSSPVTELAAAATQLHDLFVSYTTAGFTEGQVLRIVIGVITSGVGGGTDPDASNAKARKDAADALTAHTKADKDAEKIDNGR
jgi:hypothetical protein